MNANRMGDARAIPTPRGGDSRHSEKGCPFAKRAGGVPLSEIASILRLGDRARFSRAVEQLETSLANASDLDEARGLALTFLSVVTAAMLELGGTRDMHREQMDAARELERLHDPEAVARAVCRRVEAVAAPRLAGGGGGSSHLVWRATALVERLYAQELSDDAIAARVGLSTSHFRALFRRETGQPFHQYLLAVRLEKAHRMLLDGREGVGEVARAVGFRGASHFSRAFARRFGASPAGLRRGSESVRERAESGW